MAGQGSMRQGRAAQRRAGQHDAGQDSMMQGRAAQHDAAQREVGQGRAGHKMHSLPTDAGCKGCAGA